MIENEMFPTEMMYFIGNGDESLCSYDFSLLPAKLYDKFFNSLPNILYKKVSNVVFSCETWEKYKNTSNITNKKLKAITESIAYQRKNYLNYLMKILIQILPKTKSLRSLQLISLDIDEHQMKTLFTSIAQCKTLECISFKNIFTTDENFSYLLQYISPYKYREISFVKCGLTSKSYPAICEFIQRKPFTSQINRKLRIFNVDDCLFSIEEINKIEDLVNDAQDDQTTIGTEIATVTVDSEEDEKESQTISEPEEAVERDLQNSDDHESKSLQSLQSSTINSSNFANVELPKHRLRSLNPEFTEATIHLKRTTQIQDFDISDFPEPETLSDYQLASQNKELRKIRDAIVAKLNGSLYDDDTILIGEGSKELCEVMNGMKAKIEEYEALQN